MYEIHLLLLLRKENEVSNSSCSYERNLCLSFTWPEINQDLNDAGVLTGSDPIEAMNFSDDITQLHQ